MWIVSAASAAAAPQYQIFDIGIIQAGDTASQGFGVSAGGVAVGRSVRSGGSQAFRWTQGGGLVGLPNLAGRNFAVSNDANENGIVVGTAATTLFGSSRLPVIWNNGVVSQLPLPAGETLGDANGVNASGIAVGSVDGGSLQQAVIYNGASATVITQTTSTGCFFVTAFGINDSGRIVGTGIDPNNAARNVGMVYDMGSGSAFEVGALPGANGALAFAVSNNGHVVGSSMMNQGSGLPFIYSDGAGIRPIPLATGTSQGSARGVNSAGWVVGQDSSAFSIPFLWDGGTTYRLADLIPAGSGWDLDMNTSSSALGISDDGVIVGTGVHNGEVHAYAMVPVGPTPTPTVTPPPSPTATPTPTATAFPTPSLGPTPTPTPIPTATPCQGVVYQENFDGVVAPNLPANWSASFTSGAADCTPAGTCAQGTNWVTTTTGSDTAPNCAFHNAPGCVTDSNLDTRPFAIPGPAGNQLHFRHNYDLESARDGGVLEISIAGGAFTDIIMAGGSFGQGGYNGTISTGFLSPIAGRPAWTGNSNGYITTSINLPPAASGQNVVFRFRLATDCSGAGTGWRVDTITGTLPTPCPTPTPTPTPPPTPTPVAPIDIGVSIEDSPDPVMAGQNLTYTIIVSNFGPGFSAPITLTDSLPAGVTFVSVTPSQGSCTNDVICHFGSLPDSASATVTLVVTPTQAGPLSNTASLQSSAPDPVPFNNSATASTTVLPAGTPTPTPTPTIAPTPTPSPTPTPTPSPTKALNLSTRMRVQTGNNVGIGGFIISGNASKNVAIRGIGPSLGSFGITDALANPTLELRDSNGGVIKLNDDWTDNAADAAQLTLLGLAPSNSKESGMVATLQPGASYTAILAGKNQTAGVGLVEIYDVEQSANSQLANISTRSFVQSGNDVTIAGFILGGNNDTRMVVRGLGPSLAQFGLSPVLADPTLELRDSNGTLVILNDDWQDDPTMTMPGQLVARGLAPQNPKESAVILFLPPGAFTAILAGKNGGTGIGLVELYNVQ